MDEHTQRLFDKAQEAGFKRFEEEPKADALQHWLCAEVAFAEAVGITMVKSPNQPPAEEWQCRVWQDIAEALCTMRHLQFGKARNASAT